LELQCARSGGFEGFQTSVSEAQETNLMHVQFAYAAIIKATKGEASIGDAAYAVWPVIGATVEGSDRAARSAPVFAPFNQENEILAFPGSELRVRPTPRESVPLQSLRGTSARTGAVPGGGAISSRACSAGHAALEIEAKILAGDGARAGKVAYSACMGSGVAFSGGRMRIAQAGDNIRRRTSRRMARNVRARRCGFAVANSIRNAACNAAPLRFTT
jgi:hypothetical protein